MGLEATGLLWAFVKPINVNGDVKMHASGIVNKKRAGSRARKQRVHAHT